MSIVVYNQETSVLRTSNKIS
ncbi:unnamed protein product [Leptidea sinapis]|uniref:Uncharacterized protein n=1 Tax=Leptidea sinapis TaxID=189913 RepID=A0A5E4QS30_9NEOP|nr:unnamed protein product [Leptidea sinapis]